MVKPGNPIDAKVIATVNYAGPNGASKIQFYDNGHFNSPDNPDHRWFLRGSTMVCRWGWSVDNCTLAADGRSFKGQNLKNEPVHVDVVTGSFADTAEPKSPAARGGVPAEKPRTHGTQTWVTLFRSDDPSIWNLPRGSSSDANGFATDVNATAPDDTKYLRIRKGTDSAIIELSKDDLLQNTAVWCGTDWNGDRAFHLGIKNPAWKKLEKGLVDVDSNFQGWGFGHIESVDGQGYCWGGKNIQRTVLEIAVKSGELTDAEKKVLVKAN